MWTYFAIVFLTSTFFLQGEALQCYQCNSKENPECAHWRKLQDIKKVECVDPADVCVEALENNRVTVRGCRKEVDDLPAKCEGGDCITCNSELCNNGVVPRDRPLCHICDKKSDANCGNKIDDNKNSPIPCQYYNFREKCYTAVSEDGSHIKRGCMSDDDVTLCKDKINKCLECPGYGDGIGCNNVEAFKKSDLTCYSCGEDKEDCAWGMPGSDIKPSACTKPEYFGKRNRCYKHEKDGAVNRGCLEDLDATDPIYKACNTVTNTDCKTCTDANCNKEKSELKYHTCYKCRSTKIGEQSCDTDVKQFIAEKCYNTEQTKKDIGCYTLQLPGDTIRGCTKDMPKEFVDKCNEEKEFCKKCGSDHCNREVLTPRSSAIKISSATWWAISLIVGFLTI